MGRTTGESVYMAAEVVSGMLSTVNNALVLLLISRSPTLHTPTAVFVGNLALADFVVGVVGPPTTILPTYGLPHDFEACLLLNSLIVIATHISMLSMLAIAVDRYLSICRPLTSRRLLTIPRAAMTAGLIWAVGILLGLVPNFGWNKGRDNFKGVCAFQDTIDLDYMVYLVFFCLTLPLLLLVLCLYIRIYLTVRRINRQTRRRSCVPNSGGCREIRGIKSLFIVVVTFACCWLPLHTINCTIVLAPARFPGKDVLLFAIVLSHANSFMNPIIYCLFNKNYRGVFWQFIRGSNRYSTYSLNDTPRTGVCSRLSWPMTGTTSTVLETPAGTKYNHPAPGPDAAVAARRDPATNESGSGDDEGQSPRTLSDDESSASRTSHSESTVDESGDSQSRDSKRSLAGQEVEGEDSARGEEIVSGEGTDDSGLRNSRSPHGAGSKTN